MRELIDVKFSDQTSYPAQAGEDVGALVIDCPWGPSDRIVKANMSSFMNLFPLSTTSELTQSQLAAYTSFLAGLQSLELVRYGDNAKYFTLDFSGLNATPATPIVKGEALSLETETLKVALAYKGYHPEFALLGRHYKVEVSSALEEGLDTVTVTLYYLTATLGVETPDFVTETGVDKFIVEVVKGGNKVGQVVDGKNFFLGDALNSSKYFTGAALKADFKSPATAQKFTLVAHDDKVYLDTLWVKAENVADLVNEYLDYFTDVESSEATILIDPGTTAKAEADTLTALAANRTDLVAIVGYPTIGAWAPGTSDDPVSLYHASLSKTMMGAFYAVRERVTLFGRTYITNGIGTIAGRYASVASQESINQLPSAKTWGAFGGVLDKNISFAQVLEWHAKGINSVYNTNTGPRIFGLRSLHPRESSYYSRFNVGRVSARLLKYAFSVAFDVIHTGNTSAKKALVQNLLNADLNRLKAVGAVKMPSSVKCDDKNNQDIDTSGGKILVIEYTMYFVSLIERVKITITATDTSVSAQFS